MPVTVLDYPVIDIEGFFYAFYRFLLKLGAVFDVTTAATVSTVPNPSSPGFQNFYLYAEIFFLLIAVAAFAVLLHFYWAKKAVEEKVHGGFTARYQTKITTPAKNALWDAIQEHIASDAQAAWKLAVIEADKMLDDLTVQQGFFGATLGERLKNADDSVFRTLQDAWEAHKIRNRIAHEAGFHLTRREAQRAISMYERVFREFKIV